MRRLMVALAAVAACAAAHAVEAAPAKTGTPGGAFAVNSRTDPVLCRLGLTEQQVAAIDKINQETDAKRSEFRGPKARQLHEEVSTKVRAVLTAEQQPKFDEGVKIVAACEEKIKAAHADMAAAVKADAGKKDEARKVYDDKADAARAERDSALDQKVGKAPGKSAGKAADKD